MEKRGEVWFYRRAYRGRMDANEGTAVRLRRGVARWLPAGSLALAAAVFLVPSSRDVVSVMVGVVLLLAAVGLSPLLFPRSLDDAAARTEAAARGVPLIYWRPGCTYCLRMRVALGTIGRKAVWVDVSRDDQASVRVREVNGGNETVPTVFVGDNPHTNPSPSWVRGQLAA